MSTPLYQRCDLCRQFPPLHCPACNGVGFVQIGLTLGQVDRLVKQEMRRQAQAAGLACEHGVRDGEYCPYCNREYKAARREAEAVEEKVDVRTRMG